MGHAIRTEKGWEFSTDYAGVFNEPGNMEVVIELRSVLRDIGLARRVVLQPGDGTRYEFLLCPKPDAHVVFDRSHEEARKPRLEIPGRRDLLVTSLDGLVRGVCSISSENDLAGIRYRLSDKTDIDSPCTWEALARLVEAVWSDGWQA